MAVGTGFGSFNTKRRMQIPMEVNPLDKCTIVSAYPKRIKAEKPTIFPSRFEIAAAADNDYELLVVGPSSWWREIDEHMPLQEIPCSSFQVGSAIVNDFINALLGAKGHSQKPAVFLCLGEYNKATIKTYKDKVSGKSFDALLKEALIAQKAYFTELVRIADISWARTNGNPLAISDDARLAAEKLGLKDSKAWMGDFKALELVNCKACGSMVNPNYPICATCHHPIMGITLGK